MVEGTCRVKMMTLTPPTEDQASTPVRQDYRPVCLSHTLLVRPLTLFSKTVLLKRLFFSAVLQRVVESESLHLYSLSAPFAVEKCAPDCCQKEGKDPASQRFFF